MIRAFLAIAALAGAGACATGAAYSPRPFPGAPATAATTSVSPASAPAVASAGVPVSPDPAAAAGPAPSGDRTSVSDTILATAMSLRGIPYRLGGADTTGFDCSGLVQYVLRQHGIDMPRTVIDQFSVGAATPDIQPGDLVFFQTIGSQASHVGIAVDGVSFVHAPNSRGVVRIDRLDAPYWSSRFVGARRVF